MYNDKKSFLKDDSLHILQRLKEFLKKHENQDKNLTKIMVSHWFLKIESNLSFAWFHPVI
jgi:hypothetical protein